MHSSYTSYRSCHFFFFNDTATTEIYTLSLHDALPISLRGDAVRAAGTVLDAEVQDVVAQLARSEEHTSELQSRSDLVCRLLLEKKKKQRFHTCPEERYLTYHAINHRSRQLAFFGGTLR